MQKCVLPQTLRIESADDSLEVYFGAKIRYVIL